MKIALIGNQNSGKSTLFNVLTGSNQKIGNWPGVTVEKKSGILKQTNYEVIDLPGIYSLSPYTNEEEVSRNFLLNEKPDLIINTIDATSLERSLYLTTQLLELDFPVILCLNMCDLLEKKGLKIHEEKLSTELGVNVLKISALKKTGIDNLINLIKSKKYKTNHKKIYDIKIENILNHISNTLDNISNKRFVSVKILERDEKMLNFVKSYKDLEENIKSIENYYKLDTEQIIANQRYNYIVNIKEKVVNKAEHKLTITDKLDKIFLNKWLAIPIFIIIMGFVYFLSVGIVGNFTVNLMNNAFSSLKETTSSFLSSLGASDWSISLVCDGIISGVGSVINFVPQLIILFLCISILETTGYMSRIAFFFDRLFRKFGLSGKSLVPFIVGSGCSVPAIMTTRTIEDENEKHTTIMLTPFIPCSAKLPIIALFSGIFFGNVSWLITVSLYFLAITIIIISAIIIRKNFLKGKSTTFISELPEYKMPNIKYILKDVWEKSWAFVKRAGTIILIFSIVLWVLLSFNWKFEFGVNVEDSILASIGNCFSWFFYPILGTFSWGATVSAIQGLVAKEQVISSMAVISGLAKGVEDGALILSSSGIFGFFNPVNAYAFMVFNLFSAPCFGAIGAMYKEFGSAKKTLLAVAFQIGVAWVLATLINIIGSIIFI